ncbi:MAG: DUF402 domain-containing protein [Gemmatimonadetes bacterium]|nr:DUF402 domain-containing protein [Gemmatimonadota bacterium]MDQ3401237.1 DUF402 domain-containing protein [Chloroflexota bacterium]
MRRWSAGDSVLWRTGRDGKVWSAHPMNVVRDGEALVALCIRPGVTIMRRSGLRGGPRGRNLILWDGGHEPREWHTNRALILNRPGDAHSVHLYWNGRDEFIGWYVNLEAPWRRHALGFDSEDHDLDVLIAPDLSGWRWKDEDELAFAIANGRFTEDDAQRFHAEGLRAIDRVLRREPPLDEPWERWRSDPSWPLPALPPGWDAPA